MARRGQPVLYELLGSASATAAPSAHRHAPNEGASALPPRQSVRVPVGWFWLAAVAGLVLVAIAYQFGRAAGDRAGFARGQEWRSDRDELSRLAVQTPDPMRDSGANEGRGGASRTSAPRPLDGGRRADDASARGDGSGRPSGASGAGVPTGGGAPSIGDPRVRGLNYWIVARPGLDEANAIADFVRSNGLEVAVVPDNNPRFRRIVAVPGFQSGSDPKRREQEAKIRSIGKLWKNAARGNRDFDDAYPELYR